MLSVQGVKRIVVAQWLVDFRKGHLGLLGECRTAGFEPWSGDCVLFVSRCRTRIKMLFADDTGLWVAYKQFAKGSLSTELDWLHKPSAKTISVADLAMLLGGHKYTVTRRKQPWRPRHLDNI